MSRTRRGFDGLPADLFAARRLARVTDHAVIRWLERVDGFPVAAVREGMLLEPVLHGMALGARAVTIDGVVYCLQGHTITTIMPAGESR